MGALVLLVVAATATWWCMRQPPLLGLPVLIFVLFAEIVVVLGVFAARARAVLWEYTARISHVERALADLQRVKGTAPKLQQGYQPAGVYSSESCEAETGETLRGEIATLGDRLIESVSRARYDIEDGKALMINLFERLDHPTGPRSE